MVLMTMMTLCVPCQVNNKVQQAVNPVDEESDARDDETYQSKRLMAEYQVCPPGVEHQGPGGEHEAEHQAQGGGGVGRGEDEEHRHRPQQGTLTQYGKHYVADNSEHFQIRIVCAAVSFETKTNYRLKIK